MNEPAVIVALIAAISAIVSPLVTAIINSRTQRKLAKMNAEYKYKLKLITEFAESFEEIANQNNYIVAAKAQSSATKLSTICRETETRKALLELSDYLTNNPCRDETSCALFNQCISLISKENSKSLLAK